MVILIKFLDSCFGGIVCRALSVFRREKQIPDNPKNILIIQLWGLGETVLTLPAIEAIRKKFPSSNIDILATSRNRAVYENKIKANVVEVKTNPWSIKLFILRNLNKYDIAIDMEEYLNVSAIISFFAAKYSAGYSHGARAGLYDLKVDYNDEQHASMTFMNLADSLGLKNEVEKLVPLAYSEADKKFVEKYLKENKLGKEKIVCIASGAAESAKSRMWPKDRYGKLCNELIKKHKCTIILTGTSEENKLLEEVMFFVSEKDKILNSAGVFSLGQLFYLLEKCTLFIGNDSGPMHVAAAQGTKTIGLFGPNTPVRFGPFGKNCISVYKKYSCKFSPCINVHKGEVPDCLYARNSSDYQKCMKAISVDDVMREAEKMLK